MARISVSIERKTLMVTIIWNPTGFHIIGVLPNGCNFNSSYHIQENETLGSLSEWRSEQAGAASRRLIDHLTTPDLIEHTAAASQKDHGRERDDRSPHPPYSPDLAPSDFSLFDYVKHCLRGQSFEAVDEFFSFIEVVLRGIGESTFNAVFLWWMERLEQCNATNGDYFEDT
jgi:hypothetical protein